MQLLKRQDKMPRRDPSEFSQKTIETLAKRAAQRCSNPQCKRPTSGPHSEPDRSITVGKAAHIRGQRPGPGSARYDENMTDEERRHISNGIWLCAVCHDAVDRDETAYTVNVLQTWKVEHEQSISKAMLSSLGFISDSPINITATADVLEDENIKTAIQAWGKGDLETAAKYSQAAYHSGTGEIKLQGIVNLILLSQDQLQRSSYYASLADEAIALAGRLDDSAVVAIVKAHKAYFLQNRAFDNSLKAYEETQMRTKLGYPTRTNAELTRIYEAIKVDATEIDRLLNEAQVDAYNSKNLSAVAHVKMTAGGAIGLTYFMTKQLGGDTGQIEQLTARFLLEAKEIYEKLEDKEGIGDCLHNLANNLRFFGDIEQAKHNATEALKIAQENGYKELEMKATELLSRLEPE